MVNFVTKINSSAAKAGFKIRLNEMRLRLKQRMLEKENEQKQFAEYFEHQQQMQQKKVMLVSDDLVDSGLASKQNSFNDLMDESIISLDMISVINKTFTEYSKTSSRTSTPIFHGKKNCCTNVLKNKRILINQHSQQKQKKESIKKIAKHIALPQSKTGLSSVSSDSVSRKQKKMTKLKISNFYSSQNDLDYFNLNRNNKYNYEIDTKNLNEMNLFYNYNNVSSDNTNGFHDYGALKVWYV